MKDLISFYVEQIWDHRIEKGKQNKKTWILAIFQRVFSCDFTVQRSTGPINQSDRQSHGSLKCFTDSPMGL